jgi:hypothetical protein
MRFFVTPVTAINRDPPQGDHQGRESESSSVNRENPADKQEFVMTSSITTGVTVFFIIVGVWAANLVCYHPLASGLDPTTPVRLTIDQ